MHPMQGPDGIALVYRYRGSLADHHLLQDGMAEVLSFAASPGVDGVAPLTAWERSSASFAYPVGRAELLSTSLDHTPRPRAAMQLLAAAAPILEEAASRAEAAGLYCHGALAPDRLAAYSYAHVPWLKRHQQRIDEGALPAPADKLGLFLQARQFLAARGYEPIGMDHFARPDDELAVAARAGHLHRNFMGYTTMRGVPLIGYGVSAISEVGGLFAQQQPHLGAWYRAMADVDGPPVVHRGYRMTDDDHVRSELIAELMCNFALDVDAFEVRHGLRFADAFASELAALAPLVDDGLVNLSPRRLQVTELGRLLVRNVAMCFDAHLGRSGARFSRTV